MAQLHKYCGISPENVQKLQYYVEKALGLVSDSNIEQYEKLNSKTSSIIEGFMKIITSLFCNEGVFQPDYRVLLHSNNKKNTGSTTKSQTKGLSQPSNKVYEYSMHFRCLNPAVGFREVTKVGAFGKSLGIMLFRWHIPLF